MQAAAAGAIGRSGVRSVLRGVLFAAGVAARATMRTVERFVRREALIYVTGEITLADVLLYATATFEDVPPEPAPAPDVDARIVAVLGGVIVTAGALLVVHSIAEAVGDYYTSTRNSRYRPYAQTGQRRHSRSTHEAPAPAPAPAPASPPPQRAIEPYDACRAVAAWAQECEAAGIKLQYLQLPCNTFYRGF